MTLFTDMNGLQLTASCEQTVHRLDEFSHALLSFSADIEVIPEVADGDPDCPLAQAWAAQFFISGYTRESHSLAQKYLHRAQYLYSDSLPREQAIISSVQYAYRTELHAAAAVLDDVLDDHPQDIISAKWAQGLYFDIGDAAGILRAPVKVAGQHDANPYLHGMLAFGFEECHLLEDAGACTRTCRALGASCNGAYSRGAQHPGQRSRFYAGDERKLEWPDLFYVHP